MRPYNPELLDASDCRPMFLQVISQCAILSPRGNEGDCQTKAESNAHEFHDIRVTESSPNTHFSPQSL